MSFIESFFQFVARTSTFSKLKSIDVYLFQHNDPLSKNRKVIKADDF